MVLRELTMDDLQDKLTMKGTLLDILAATAERAEEIYQTERAKKARETTPPPPPPPPKKRSRERTAPRIISRGNGHGKRKKRRSTSSASKKEMRSNSPKKKDINPPQPTWPPPPLPADVKNAIEEMSNCVTAVELVMQKFLTATDVNPIQSRLLIPFNQIILRKDFLKEEEKRYLRRHEEGTKNKKFKWVKMLEPSLAMATVKLRRWDMTASSSYIINGEWNGIVKRNHLEQGTEIQLWCFRVDNDLCFALVCIN